MARQDERKPIKPVHEHCWHDAGTAALGTVNLCCKCLLDGICIVTVVEKLSPAIKRFQRQHPIYQFIEAPTELPETLDAVQAIGPTEREKSLRVIRQ